MKLQEARMLAGFDREDVEHIFGVTDIEELEANNESKDLLKGFLLREFLRTPKKDIGHYTVVTASRASLGTDYPEKIVDIIRSVSKEEAVLMFGTLCSRYIPVKSNASDRFYEISVWKCDENWQPVKNIKRITKEY